MAFVRWSALAVVLLALLAVFAPGCVPESTDPPVDPNDNDPDTPSNVVETSGKVFDNSNIYTVFNYPTNPTTFTIDYPCQVTRIHSYHWNNGQGVEAAGTIGLESADGTTYGPWQATGSEGQGGIPNANWECGPNVSIPAGTYRVVDSDSNTWSQNHASGGRGMCIVEGVLHEKKSDILLREPVRPSNQEQTFNWENKISVTVPAGLLESEQILTIRRIPTPPPSDDPTLRETAIVYDVSLGNLHEFSQPLEVEMVYAPSEFSTLGSPEDCLTAAYWDPALESWVAAPGAVDPSANVLVVKVDHLSRVAGLRRVTPGYLHNDFFGLSYVRSLVEAGTGTAAGWYTKPEPSVPDRDPGIPDYVEDVWHFLNRHRETFEDLKNANGLQLKPLPTVNDEPGLERLPISASVGGEGHPYRNKITGDIRISLDCASGPDILSPLVAHELFHAVQNQYYTCAGMTARKWWVEATAEYAAGRIAVRGSPYMGGAITPRYLEMPLDWSAGLLTSSTSIHRDHEYTTAFFLDFLVSTKGVDFIDMWTTMAKSWSMNMLSVLADYLDGKLPQYYREFAEYWVFGSGSPVHGTLKSKGFVEASFINETSWIPPAGSLVKAIMLERYNSAMVRAVIDGAADKDFSLTVGVDKEWHDTIPPGASVVAYLFPGDSYDASRRLGVLNASNDEIKFSASTGDVLYLLVINATTTAQVTSFIVQEDGESDLLKRIKQAKDVRVAFFGDLVWKVVEDEEEFTYENYRSVIWRAGDETGGLTWIGRTFTAETDECRITGTLSADGRTLLECVAVNKRVVDDRKRVVSPPPFDPSKENLTLADVPLQWDVIQDDGWFACGADYPATGSAQTYATPEFQIVIGRTRVGGGLWPSWPIDVKWDTVSVYVNFGIKLGTTY